jgi:hypothetical protein
MERHEIRTVFIVQNLKVARSTRFCRGGVTVRFSNSKLFDVKTNVKEETPACFRFLQSLSSKPVFVTRMQERRRDKEEARTDKTMTRIRQLHEHDTNNDKREDNFEHAIALSSLTRQHLQTCKRTQSPTSSFSEGSTSSSIDIPMVSPSSSSSSSSWAGNSNPFASPSFCGDGGEVGVQCGVS